MPRHSAFFSFLEIAREVVRCSCMNILMITAEMAPFASVGGLSQVMYFLSKSLVKAGHDVRVFTPLYGKINTRKYKTQSYIKHLPVPVLSKRRSDPSTLDCSIRTYKRTKPTVYFVENREYFHLRENAYGYGDDHKRFYLMCKAALEWILIEHKTKGFVPDVIHINDWHTGYFAELARSDKRYKTILNTIPILHTVHNFRYQGNMDFAYLPPEKKDNGRTRLAGFHDEKLHSQNALLRGILYADWLNTVSPTHALEVLTSQYGEGLEKVLQRRRATLSGIINGLDTTTFDPSKDPLIAHNYSVETIEKRKENKLVLQKEFGLKQDLSIPLLAFLGRLDKQKGLHLIADVLPHLFEELGIQFVILGGGDQQIAAEFRSLAESYPSQMGVHLYANFKLPRKVFAGADILLMPSMFEPGGIVALEAQRYGAVPVVRRTGGLSDILRDFDPTTKKGNGFSFVGTHPLGLLIAITRAVETYKNKKIWNSLVRNCMTEDFSWEASMRGYVKLYKKVIELRRRHVSDNPDPAFL